MGWRVPDRGPNGEQPCVGSIYIISRKLMEESTAALAALADRYCWGCEEFYWEDTLVGNEFLRCCGTKATPLNSLIAIYDTLNPTPKFVSVF